MISRKPIRRVNPLSAYQVNRTHAEAAFTEKYKQMRGRALVQMFKETAKTKGLSFDARKIQAQIVALEQKKLKTSQIKALKAELIKYFVKNGVSEVQY